MPRSPSPSPRALITCNSTGLGTVQVKLAREETKTSTPPPPNRIQCNNNFLASIQRHVTFDVYFDVYIHVPRLFPLGVKKKGGRGDGKFMSRGMDCWRTRI